MTRKPFLLTLLLLNALWTFALVVAPFTLAAGTVRGLDGRANLIDYWDTWKGLPWYSAVTYAFGDLNCHQMEIRSLILHGNQLPVDARMTALFIAANLGLVTVLALPTRRRARDEATGLIPRRWRAAFASPRARLALLTSTLLIGALPATIDVLAQFFTNYESTNALRLVTGALLGLLGAVWVGIMFDSLLAPHGIVTSAGEATQGRPELRP